MLTLSQKDRDRLVVLHQVKASELSLSEAARRLGIGVRWMRRLQRRFEREGDPVVVHGLRGRPSNRRLEPGLRERALAKAREPLYADFGPTLLGEHLGREGIGSVSSSTLRLWLIEAGLWTPEPRKQKHRRRRERRASVGELVLMDTSIHAWLEERSGEEIVLIALIDDASSRLHARFFPRDTGAANRRLLIDYIERFGRMGAVYADCAGHFRVNFNRSKRRADDQAEALTLIQRSLLELDIELIRALSPQAKGRVERLFGTLQDRLIKEMRVAGIGSLEEANAFLENHFIPFWHDRFTVTPARATDAHRPVPDEVVLLALFAETEERTVRNDFTFRFRNQHYQIEEKDAVVALPKSRVTIEKRLDGTVHFRWRDQYLTPTPLKAPPQPPVQPRAAPTGTARPLTGAAGKPIPPDHPWRRFPVRVGAGRFRTSAPVAATAPAALRPDAPASVAAS